MPIGRWKGEGISLFCMFLWMLNVNKYCQSQRAGCVHSTRDLHEIIFRIHLPGESGCALWSLPHLSHVYCSSPAHSFQACTLTQGPPRRRIFFWVNLSQGFIRACPLAIHKGDQPTFMATYQSVLSSCQICAPSFWAMYLWIRSF